MDNAVLEIVLKARDEATKTIEGMTGAVDDASKHTAAMSTAFKEAGGVLLGVGIAGVGIMKVLADAAGEHQVAMASVDVTLKNVAASMATTTIATAGNKTEVKSATAAIDDHIRSLKEQILNYETMGGSHKSEIAALQEQVKAEDLLKLKEQDVKVTTGGSITVVNEHAMSLKQLQDATQKAADTMLQLGFNEDDTSKAFAQDLFITKDVGDANKVLAATADYARLKGLDLADAGQKMTLAYEGNTRALKALGIELPKGTQGMDAINAVMGRTSGQAEAFAHTYEGATQVLSANFDKLKVTLGERLLPTLNDFMQSIVKVIEHLNNLSPKTYDTIVNVLKFGTAFALIGGPILLFIGFLPALIAGFGAIAGAALPLTVILVAVGVAAYLIYTHWNEITAAFVKAKPAIDTIFKALQQFWVSIQPQLTALMKTISEFITYVVNAIGNWIKDNTDTFVAFWEVIKGIFTFALGFIQGFWQTTWGAIKDYLVAIWDIMKGVVEIAWGIITVFIDIAMGLFTGNWTKAWQGIKKGLGDIWDGIKDIIMGALDFIISSVKLALDTVIGFINGIISGANSVMSKIPGNHLTIPLIPHFETGGYVPKTGLAVVHEGEFVLSKDMLAGKQQIPSTVNSKTYQQPITINATINETFDLNLLGQKLAFAMRNSR